MIPVVGVINLNYQANLHLNINIPCTDKIIYLILYVLLSLNNLINTFLQITCIVTVFFQLKYQ